MRKHLSKICTALIFSGLCFCHSVFAQEQDSAIRKVQLNVVTVNALAIPIKNQDFGGMVGVISPKEIRSADPTNVTEQLNRIPGLTMQSGTLTTNRIAIRGVGARSAFSTNKIRAYYGEIPLTDGGGETTLEDIDLSFIQSVEIIKGPNSTLYGSGLGGVILLTPAMDTSSTASIRSTIGSFGLIRVGSLLSVGNQISSLTMGLQRQSSEGFRQNNRSEKNTFYVSAQREAGNNQLQLLTVFQNNRAQIPSSLGFTAYNENPESAASNWAQAKGFEDYSKWLVGLGWKHQFDEHFSSSQSIYTNWKNNYEPRPFNILEDKLSGMGMRSRVGYQGTFIKLNLGAELYRDIYEWKTFENLLDPENPGSEKGDLLSSNSEQRSFTNIFLQSVVEIANQTHLESGINFNYTSYNFSSQGDTFYKKFKPTPSPRLSVVQGVSDDINLFATVSHGFSPPSIEETLNQLGGFNREIQPETGWNREIGIKGAHRTVNYAVSYYWMDIQNLLVTRRTDEDVTFGKNAGSTKHYGLEGTVEVLIFKNGQSQFRATGSMALNNYSFKKFEDDGVNYSGNQLTGVPDQQWNVTVFQEGKLVYSGLNFLSVGEIPVTDDNSIVAKNYQLLNGFVGIRLPITTRLKADVSYRMNNILDEKYASMLNVNATSFGNAEPRYYYPGMPRNHQVTLRVYY